MRQYCILFLFILAIIPDTLLAQQSPLPIVVSPSPQSTALTRYGDYPMAGCNGLTDITIPLHTVTGKKLSLPVTMSFHASGRMANETNGVLGMRWTLNCGGLVTRTMKGLPDEWNLQTPFDVTQYINTTPPDYDALYGACMQDRIINLPYQDVNNQTTVPKYDSEYDIFSYSLPSGKQGHFILKTVSGVKVPMLIPYEPLKIELVKESSTNGWIEQIKITDTDGTQYFLGKIDGTTANAIEYTYEPDILNGAIGNLPTAWYLTKIASADASDQLTLSYVSHYRTVWNSYQNANIGDRLRDYTTDLSSGPYDTYEQMLRDDLVSFHFEPDYDPVSISISRPNVPAVSGITFTGGSASFSYNTAQLLTQIVVNNNSTPYKKITFNPVKHADEEELYYLDDVKFYGEDQTTLGEKYAFTYYEGSAVVSQTACMQKDWWGYYKFTTDLLPAQTIPISQIGGGGSTTQNIGFSVSREPDNQHLMGMIKTITYPTGGATEFIHEKNQYDWKPYYIAGQNTYLQDGPGLRIKEIISTPVSGKPVHKIYKYGIYEDGRGYINELLRPGTSSWQNLTATESNVMHFWEAGFAYHHLGYRSRTFLSDPYINFDLGGMQIKYDGVTEYYVTDNGNEQKTKTRYEWFDNEQVIGYNITDVNQTITYPRKFANPEDAWKTPVMTRKEFYKYSNSNFDLLRKETYTYDDMGMVAWDEAYDMPTYLHTSVIYARTGIYESYVARKDYHNNLCSVVGYGFRRYSTAKRRLLSSKVEEFSSSGTITTEKEYEYEETYNSFVKSEEVTNSDGLVTKTDYSYPSDFPAATVYQQMVQKNIIAPVVEQVSIENAVQTKKVTTSYFSPYTGIFVPQSVTIKNGSHPSKTIASFNTYNSQGQILEQQKSDDVKEVYLWCYDSRYPVAKVVGSDYTTVSSVVSQAQINTAVASNNDQTLRTLLHTLRTDPATKHAFTNTYTFKPLVGITSETDARGKTVFYEYDNFNRLKLVRDDDGNIIKRICYNYAGQPEDCVQGTTALWQPTGIVRCQPCAANANYTNGIQEHEERDNNSNSPTYNTTRWVSDGSSPSCTPQPDWQNTSTPLRCMAGSTTGQQEQEQLDLNPCSPTYNQTRWVGAGKDINACPPAACEDCREGDLDKCIGGVCETAVKVYISSVEGETKGEWICGYRYEWSDCSSTPVAYEVHTSPCTLNTTCP